MKLKSTKKLRKRKSRTLLVLPILKNINKSEEDLTIMPKNPGLKLFTKSTWPPKSGSNKENKEDADDSGDTSRPLTATLEKPAVLDIRLLGKLDMSTVTKEFINITNICKFPITFTITSKRKKSKTLNNRPLSLPATQQKSLSKRSRKCDTSEDSWEDEESIKSAQINPKQVKKHGKIKPASGSLTGSRDKDSGKEIMFKNTASDANNNSKTFKIARKRMDNAGKVLNVKTELSGKSTKLPEPCKTCGRPNQPERFHSHPATPVRPPKKMEDPPKIPVKSTVQKPIAMKYKSKQTTENKVPVNRKPSLPAQKLVHTPPSLDVNVKDKDFLPAQKLVHTPMILEKRDSLPAQKLVHTPPNVGDQKVTSDGEQKATVRAKSAKRTLTCYLCGREFGTASLPLHEPKCLEKWRRENANLPEHMRRKEPQKPDHPMTQEEWDKFAWESSQEQLIPCKNCGRTFFPDRLVVHQRSCRDTGNTGKSHPETIASVGTPPSMSQDTSATSPIQPPPTVECYICGRMFGTHSIKIHEKQCLKKWRIENDSLPPDMRAPEPTRKAKQKTQLQVSESSDEAAASTSVPEVKERPASAKKAPLFPCYLCGRLFSVHSIYIHEPQCLEKWKIENDKLPPNKRRPIPLKPDIKFTRDGKVDFDAINEANWQTHLSQLVPCKFCSRTFNPDRVEIHEKSCKG